MMGTNHSGRVPVGIRVLLCDDEPHLRLLLATALEMDGRFEIVGEVEEVGAVVDAALATTPDAIVLDLQLIDGDASVIMPVLRSAVPGSMIFVFSAQSRDERWPSLQERGAFRYAEKRPETIRKFSSLLHDACLGWERELAAS